MPIFGCASDEQFYDELYDEISQRDYDLHYCETHDSYYCEKINECDPSRNYYPAGHECRAYRSVFNAK